MFLQEETLKGYLGLTKDGETLKVENLLNHQQKVDTTKYCKVKHINLRDVTECGKKDYQCTFNLSDYPDYDDIIEIRTVEQSISEYRGMYITIGKLKKEFKK